MRYAMFLVLACGALAIPVSDAADHEPASCSTFATEFIDVSALGRKNSAAEKMTERANERAAQGWRQVDMEIYTENGDLEGFFMVFERTGACSGELPN